MLLNHMVSYTEPLDRVFHALADPTRRQMLRSLASGDRNISELAAPFRMTFPAASKHVRVLEEAGLVRRRISGRAHVCCIEPVALAAASEWLRFYERLWSQRFDNLGALLDRPDAPLHSTRAKKGHRP